MIGDGDPISTTQPRELHFAFSTMDWPALVCIRKHRLFFFFFTLSLLALAMAGVLVWRMSGICQQNAGPIYCIAHGLWLYRDDP